MSKSSKPTRKEKTEHRTKWHDGKAVGCRLDHGIVDGVGGAVGPWSRHVTAPPIGLPLGRPKLIKKIQKHHNDILLSSFHLARSVYPDISRSIFEGCFYQLSSYGDDISGRQAGDYHTVLLNGAR
jgi:hypothetical protein